jgi:undecaprenyl-diphosphatase
MRSEDNLVSDIRHNTAPLGAALACSVLFLAVFVWIAEEVFEGDMQRFDSLIRSFAHRHETASRTSIMRGLSTLGSPLVLSLLVVIVVSICFWMNYRRPGAWILISMLGALVLDAVLKQLFHRQRPDPFFGTNPSSFSFPSGHALGSFCFYGVLAGLCCTRTESPVLRALIWTSASLLILGIGLSRIYLGVHYPTDVIAGYSAAAVWVSALLLADLAEERRARRYP